MNYESKQFSKEEIKTAKEYLKNANNPQKLGKNTLK